LSGWGWIEEADLTYRKKFKNAASNPVASQIFKQGSVDLNWNPSK
jgi:hypothetical protein